MKTRNRTLILGTVASVACATGTFLFAAPAQALYFSGDTFKFDFSGNRSQVAVDINGQGFDFYNTPGSGPDGFTESARVELTNVAAVNGATASQFFDYIGSIGTIKDVQFTNIGLLEFINISLVHQGDNVDSGFDLIFDLTEALSLKSTDPVIANLKGVLKLVDSNGTTQRAAVGLLTTQIDEAGNSSFSITAVPTPAAVLPGLLGMGAAAFRKKKQEDEGEMNLETADTNA